MCINNDHSSCRHRLAIVGSRDYPNLAAVDEFVRRIALFCPTTVIYTRDRWGPDGIVARAARQTGLQLHIVGKPGGSGPFGVSQQAYNTVFEVNECTVFWSGYNLDDPVLRVARSAKNGYVPVIVFDAGLKRVTLDTAGFTPEQFKPVYNVPNLLGSGAVRWEAKDPRPVPAAWDYSPPLDEPIRSVLHDDGPSG